MMSIQSISALLAAIITLAIALSVLIRDRKRKPYLTFAFFSFILFFWYLFSFFAETLQSKAMLWLSFLFAVAIPFSAERFFLAFLADKPRAPAAISRWIGGGTGLFYLLLLYGGLFYPIHHHLYFTIPLLIFVFVSLSYCVYLIYARMRATASRSEATRLTYLLYGGASCVFLAAADHIIRPWVAFPPLGNVLTVIYMYFISQTLFHYRLLDIKELLGKMVTLSALVLCLTVIYGALLAWVGSGQAGMFFFNTIVASFVIMIIFEPLRGYVEERINKWMFREKYEFSRRLLLLRQDLANIIDVHTMVSRILGQLEESERATHASIYLADPSGAAFHLGGHLGPEPIDQIEETTAHLFLDRLRETGLITMEYLEQELITQREENQEDAMLATRNIMAMMEDLEAGVCIPLISDGQMLGVLNLRDDRLREAYASDELAELRKVALQTAITLRNSKVYEKMKERDRLAALGQMAAGLAHEIRNPLGAIKGAAQLLKTPDAEEEGPTPPAEPNLEEKHAAVQPLPPSDEDDEYVDIIVEEVDRLDRVVSQFLGYARPDQGERRPLNVNNVVYKTIHLLTSQESGVDIKTDLVPNLPQVRADAEQLRQVFINLALNGIQAMEGQGPLKVGTRLRLPSRRGLNVRWVEVFFQDSGKGIPAEAIKDIFIPFFTTRDGGTGLGLPICQRIVENHGGKIEVRSQPEEGSTFSVLLPAESTS